MKNSYMIHDDKGPKVKRPVKDFKETDNVKLLKQLRDKMPIGNDRTRMTCIIGEYMFLEGTTPMKEKSEEIESNEILENLNSLNNALCVPEVNYNLTNKLYANLKNYILKTQQQEKELKEIKNKVKDIYKPLDKPLISKEDYIIAIEKFGKLAGGNDE